MSNDCRGYALAEKLLTRGYLISRSDEREWAAWRAEDLPGRNPDELARIFGHGYEDLTCARPAPKRVRLFDQAWPLEEGAQERAWIDACAVLTTQSLHGRHLRVIVEADAEEPRCPGCSCLGVGPHGPGCPAFEAEIEATEKSLRRDMTRELCASAPREEVDQAIAAGIVCPDCRGSCKYQPLMGPAEDCRACGGSGRRAR